jgi:hypothetical protein
MKGGPSLADNIAEIHASDPVVAEAHVEAVWRAWPLRARKLGTETLPRSGPIRPFKHLLVSAETPAACRSYSATCRHAGRYPLRPSQNMSKSWSKSRRRLAHPEHGGVEALLVGLPMPAPTIEVEDVGFGEIWCREEAGLTSFDPF